MNDYFIYKLNKIKFKNKRESYVVTSDAPSMLLFNPGGQEVHVADDVAPIAVEYVPFLHSVQFDGDELPTVSLQVPATHG